MGRGSTAGSAASLGEWCASDLGGGVPKQEEVHKANCLDLREARHKHECCKVLWKRLECCGKLGVSNAVNIPVGGLAPAVCVTKVPAVNARINLAALSRLTPQ